MRNALTVTQLNRYIKDMFAQNNLLYNVMVKGEISNFKESHGNYYFSLKDEGASIQAIIFASSSVKVSDISDGMQVTVVGRIAAYEKNGTYAIYVNSIENTGLGEYFIKLEALKKKLSEMGMFDESYKKEIPKYSINIGVVTAKNGAAIKDIEKTIKNKNPYARIYLYPAIVQGDIAYESIVDGIMTLDKMGLDTIIIGRGGGSIEDLYCFNDERVAYAIFNAKTPIISAVGHEINDSISDLVADLRVATPTAAGEMATFSYDDFIADIDDRKSELKRIIDQKIIDIKEKIEINERQLKFLSPRAKITRYSENISHKKEILHNLLENKITENKSRLAMYVEMLKSRDILEKLGKGLAYVTSDKGKKIKSVKDVKVGEVVDLRLKDGRLKTKVIKK